MGKDLVKIGVIIAAIAAIIAFIQLLIALIQLLFGEGFLVRTPPPYSTNIPTITSGLPTSTFIPVPSTFMLITNMAPTAMLSIKSTVQTKISPIDGMAMVYVQDGPFKMGSTDFNDSQPVHIVNISAFWIDQTDVTNSMYAKCVSAGICQSPTYTYSDKRPSYYGDPQFDNYPVIYVDWYMANTYCQWTGRRLPTEAEWEKAARGTDERIYPWGNSAGCVLANYYGNGNGSGSDYCVADTTEAWKHPDGTSLYGAYDMAGNVWQWVHDWYDPDYYRTFGRDNVQNPQGPSSGAKRVLRGGSWDSLEPHIRSAFRWDYDPAYSGDSVGFRCAQ